MITKWYYRTSARKTKFKLRKTKSKTLGGTKMKKMLSLLFCILLMMSAALAVAELHHMAQDADHQHAVVLFFVHLIGDKAGEPLLLGVQHEDILHPA